MPENRTAPPTEPPVEPKRPTGSTTLQALGKGSVVIWNAVGTTINTGVLGLSLRMRVTLGLVVAVLVVAAGITIARTLFPPVTPPPGGAVNVGIAELTNQDAAGRSADTPRSAELTQQIADLLAKRANLTSETSSVAVWPPAWTGRIDGPDRARTRAKEIGADVLVYGTLSVGPDTTRVRPRFYVTATLLSGAEELAGEHELGAEIVSPGDLGRNPGTFEDVKTKLANRSTALQQMIYGLGQYQRDDLDAAATSFDQADQNRSWDSPQGKEILYLFAGFNAGKRDKLEVAARYFASAQRYEATRIRAQLGASEVAVQQFGVQRNCTHADTDLDQLHTAESNFKTLINGPSSAGGPSIASKAHFGLAQIYLCVSQAQLEDRWAAAADEFGTVISDYKAGDASIKYLAAESYADLGFLALPVFGEAAGPQRDEKYRRAVEHYEQAIVLSDAHPKRKAFFYTRVGDINARLGQLDKTEDAYAAAIALDPDSLDIYQQQLQRARQLP